MATKPPNKTGLPSSLTVTKDNVGALFASLSRLANREVLVGFPDGEDTSERKPEPGEPKTGLTNAAIGYIQDNGSEDARIPPRPFMIPGIESVKPQVEAHLTAAALAALRGKGADAVEQRLHRAGQTATSGIKNTITDGIPPPLANATLRARAKRGRKGAQEELDRRAKGEAPGTDLAKPLIDTGQLRNAVTHVIRNRGET